MRIKFSWDKDAVAVKPMLVLTATAQRFDPVTLSHWKDEGFEVTYLPYSGTREEFGNRLKRLSDPLELGEMYAIVAYGEAATVVLELAQKPIPKLCALVAYYPTHVPAPGVGFPSSINLTVHFTQATSFVPKYRNYLYADAQPGFAETNLETHSKVAASLAWTRTLAALRKGFEIDVDLEKIWDKHLELEFATKGVDATMQTMVAEPYVNHIPTITGGVGYKDLHRFYRDYFIPGNPPSIKMTPVSRTVGTDRIVDEMHMSFTHTCEMPWMLPGVGPTNKYVEVMIVVVVCIRGTKLYNEHIYWDQASVLVQLGLLDPKLVPKGINAPRLPVTGGEAAKKVLDEGAVKSNQLIGSW